MGKVLIIGVGGVGSVVVRKCAQVPEVFTDITIAARTKAKCDALAADLPVKVKTAAVDADNVEELAKLIRRTKAELVVNVALPYQDLHIMD
ncbi:MAG: saccharopine dehydrogenase NADP-binding domain-containing protein, partial [Kiritimatiellia bacterium]